LNIKISLVIAGFELKKRKRSYDYKNQKRKLEEIRAHKEKQGFETDSITRVQQKQITEHAATVKSLEVICSKLIK